MKKIFVVMLALGMLIMSACSKPQTIEAQGMDELSDISQTESETDPDNEKAPEGSAESLIPSDSQESESETTSESAKGDNENSSGTAPRRTTIPEPNPLRPESNKDQQITIPIEFDVVDDKEEVSKNGKPASSAPVVTPTPKPAPKESSEPKPTQPPIVEPTPEPKPDPTPEPTHEPTPEPEPEPTPEPEPAFDISHWVSFAKSYGKQVGLSYDAQARDCWDNPILASPNSIYLERDIKSRLKRYVREGMTAFCVWSEQLADGRYNIYIGYA